MRIPRLHLVFAGAAACLTALAHSAPAALAQDTGWTIPSFDAQVEIQPDGRIHIVETIQADFDRLEKHGIYRDIPVRFGYDDAHERVYPVDVRSVTDRGGRAIPYTELDASPYLRLQIGDPDVTVSGLQTYVIDYTVQGALNAIAPGAEGALDAAAGHDELYWNIIGGEGWPVPVESVTVVVTAPGSGVRRATCFEGPPGSTETCASTLDAQVPRFSATGPLAAGDNFSVVVGFDKGMVPAPTPVLEARRGPGDFFKTSPLLLASSFLELVVGLGLVAMGWWRFGRDRRFIGLQYLDPDAPQETRPLGAGDQLVVEFQPPERLKPAQMGLLIDERADTLDITATIIDLGVRGYLKITDLGRGGLLEGFRHDWQLDRSAKPADDLAPYERTVLNGLFEGRDGTVKLSDLRNVYYEDLRKAQSELYESAVQAGWFPQNPETARTRWLLVGILLMVGGVGLSVALGVAAGATLLALPLVPIGFFTLLMSRSMGRRTAMGSEMLRRSLGFRQYVATAETERHKHNETHNVFAEYLPYAIVFGLVERWARAFKPIEIEQATGGWYVGQPGMAFNAATFSDGMSTFTGSVGSALPSTPSSSGSSGFGGGGFSGGGGGGGGGGSW